MTSPDRAKMSGRSKLPVEILEGSIVEKKSTPRTIAKQQQHNRIKRITITIIKVLFLVGWTGGGVTGVGYSNAMDISF